MATDRNSPTHPRRAVTAQRRLHALDRRAEGASLREIGDELGITVQGARKLIQQAMERDVPALSVEKVDRLRHVEAVKLDAVADALLPAAIQGDTNAADSWLRNRNAFARLLGLDRAVPKAAEMEDYGSEWIPPAIATPAEVAVLLGLARRGKAIAGAQPDTVDHVD